MSAVQTAVISTAAQGDNALVAAIAAGKGSAIRVLGFCLVAAGAVSVTWKSGTSAPGGGSDTALTGAMPLAANVPVSPTPLPYVVPSGLQGLFQTVAGEALNLYLSGAVGVYGWVNYQLVPA